ncbi:SusC/RagA family TonB-linked outer membrane protein [Polaribacter atrinae]|uniref:SusC/RagA family TonB-linked outer membrane protein n=1 Tax=Polaribacter atrinae TaxID=1333662 RepID=A0A176TCE8_9FLAO|nr:TonB-dependent receptor [Polaribacter atrinae]OAD45331.1 SusC/RagA family TonB-linked outer membrane protein [Polaribacter atrinae]
MKKYYLILILALGFTSYSIAQVNVSGTVVSDADGIPIPNVSVVLKGQINTGTVTDFDGVFSINLNDENGVLIFSYLGYETKEVLYSGNQKLNIILKEEANSLDEVVIVGYGSQKRSDVTGAISSVKSEDFNQGVVANAGQLLQGKVAGVNVSSSSGEPGATQDVVIRGVGSLRSGTTPLYIVDGFALDNSGNGIATNPLNFINPQDIESIEVLKDASSTAIYGSRAANGVIVITTKKGKKGRNKVNINVSSGFSTLANKVDVFTADEFRANVTAVNGTLIDGGASTNWQDELTRTAVSKNINFSMSGGTENSSYAASVGVDDQEGILRNSNLKRYSGRLNLTQKAIDDKFNVTFNLTATKLDNTRPNSGSVVSDMLSLNPTDSPYENGELKGNLSNDILNPFIGEIIYGDYTNNNRILANISPSYKIAKGLTYKLNVGVDYSITERDVQYMPYATETNTTLGSLNTATTKNNNTLIENTLTYNFYKKLSSFTFLLGYTYQQTEVNQKQFYLEGFPDNGVEPRYQIETANQQTTQSAYATKNELQSFFGRVNYTFNDKYLMTATMRADGSSKFGENNKYGYFPSVALGWNINKEGFLKDSENINNLKLRASWGQTGSQEIPSKITQASYTESNTDNNTYPLDSSASDLGGYPYGSIFTRLANPDIQWEVSTQTNIGLDFGLFRNKLTGTVDYFSKVTDNILLEVSPTDPIVPVSSYWTNIPNMEIRNNGVEIALDYNNTINKDFSYNIGGNISITKNEVVNSPYQILTTGAAQGSGQTGATINGVLNGEAIGTFYVQEFIGIGEDGLNQFTDINNDGEILDDDRIVAGNALPDYIYAFYLNFNYKKFDLGLNFNGAGGNKIYNHVAMSSFNKGNLANSFNTTGRAVEYLDESATNSNLVSTRYLEDGDFLRLNNATLAYNFTPEALGLGDNIKNLRLSITGQNLFVITDYSGFDPEINTGSPVGGIQTFGIDYYSYPKSRTILLSLNVEF